VRKSPRAQVIAGDYLSRSDYLFPNCYSVPLYFSRAYSPQDGIKNLF